MIERLVLGDNQFFGVNHMSEEKARAQSLAFQRVEAVLDVLEAAHDEGVRALMCTTHERMGEIVSRVQADTQRFPDPIFYPCLPYAHKYANAMAEVGVLGAIKQALPDQRAFDALLKGGLSIAQRDVEGLVRMLIDAEMKAFRGARTPVIFLQNVTVDLVIGVGMPQVLRVFADHVRSEYGAEAGFITMNVPKLVDSLDRAGVVDPIVCANVNKIGFRMSGGIEAYLEVMRQRRFRLMAMSVFASGAIPAREALEWVCALPNLSSIVFGASSRRNINSTRSLVDEFWPRREVLTTPEALSAAD